MKNSLKLRFGFLFVCLLIALPKTNAQDIGPALDPGLMAGWTAGEAVRYDLEKRATEARRKGIPDRPAPSTTLTGRRGSLAYVPTPALKRQVVADYVQRLQAQNPTAARAVAANFGPGKYDYSQIYRGLIDGTGLRENDAADALAGYLLLGYMIVNNIQDGKAITVPMAQSLRAQLAPYLSKNTKLNSPDRLAQLGEEMKLLTVILHAGWQSALKENTLSAYRRRTSDLFKNRYNVDFNAVRLTNQGLTQT